MIFELFICFIFLALAMIGLGYYVDIKVLAVLGFTTIFLLGLTLNLSGLSIRSGDTKVYNYVCLECGEGRQDAIPFNSSINTSSIHISSEITSYDYIPLVDQASLWIGRWLMIISVLGVALVFTSNKREDE